MSRVHDALRRAEQSAGEPRVDARVAAVAGPSQSMEGLLELVKTVPYNPSPDALVIDALHPHEAPTEEFRTLRTRLNHMQSLQPIHTAVITSPSPGEGKSFGDEVARKSSSQPATMRRSRLERLPGWV